jgi:hypothetical protein
MLWQDRPGALLRAENPADADLDLVLRPSRLDGTRVVHVLDLARDLDIPVTGMLLDPGEAARRRDEIVALVGPRLSFLVNGSPRAPRWTSVAPPADKDALWLFLDSVRQARCVPATVFRGPAAG